MNIASPELGANPTAEKCAAVCRDVVNGVEAEFALQQAEGAAIACAAGCDFCCHLRVGTFAHEAVALLHYLRTTAPPAEAVAIETRILVNARRIDGLTVAEHYAARIRCAFLVDGVCAAYDVRPSACARYHSLSRARCEQSFNRPHDMGTPKNSRPALLALQTFGAAVDTATEAALARAGLSAAKTELHQLLRTMIEDPSVIDRWRAGDAATAAASPDIT